MYLDIKFLPAARNNALLIFACGAATIASKFSAAAPAGKRRRRNFKRRQKPRPPHQRKHCHYLS
jgi:hypothetical protein